MTTREYTITTDAAASGRSSSRSRLPGLLCMAGGVIAAGGVIWLSTLHPAVSSDRVSYPQTAAAFRASEVVWTLTHLLTFFGALALVRGGWAGKGRLARVGRPILLAGMALLVPAELAFVPIASSAADSAAATVLGAVIGVAALLAGVGFALVGIAVVREHRWSGWTRWTPLLAGLWELLVLTPVGPLSGPAFLVGIGGWNVCLALLGGALYTTAPAASAE